MTNATTASTPTIITITVAMTSDDYKNDPQNATAVKKKHDH